MTCPHCPHCNRPLGEHSEKDQCLNAWAAGFLDWIDLDFISLHWWGLLNGSIGRVPSYTTSIEAAFELEESLPEELRGRYGRWLIFHPGGSIDAYWRLVHASAFDRTKAFIAAMEGQDDG